MLLHGFTNAFRHERRLVAVGEPADDQELLPAPAHDTIGLPANLGEQFRQLHEQIIPGGMAMDIVDRFETIHVQQKEREIQRVFCRAAVREFIVVFALHFGDVGRHQFLQITAVAQTRQRVGTG